MVVTIPLKKIVGQLPQMSRADRMRLRVALDFVDGGKTKQRAESVARSTDDWILPGIGRELRRRGLVTGKLSSEQISRAAPNYRADAALFCSRYQKRFQRERPGLRHAELVGLGIVFARALADYLPGVLPPNVGLGLRTMLSNVSKLPDAIEASFPDYLQCGMILALIGDVKG